MNKRLFCVRTGLIHSKGIGYDTHVDNFKVIAIDAEDAIQKVKNTQTLSESKDEKEVIESVELVSSITIE